MEVRNNNSVNLIKRLPEIPLMLFFTAFAFGETVFSNLIIYRTCNIVFGYNESICSTLVSAKESNETKHIEEEVQEYASKIIMGKSFITTIFPAILSLFLGSWSDINGRKPLIVAPLLGYSFFYSISILFSQLSLLHPLWLLVSVVPFSLTGGIGALATGCFCYISDITDMSNRSFRMVTLEGCLFSGLMIGSLATSYLFNAFGYTTIFTICAIITFIGSIYALLLKESLRNQELERCHIFSKRLIVDMFNVAIKKRSHYRRTIIWLVLISCSFSEFTQQGENNVTYLFVRLRLSWELQQFAWYGAFNILMSVLGTLIVTWIFQRWFKMKDSIISMIASLCFALKSFITTLASETWHMYLSSAITGPKSAFDPSNKAILSKCVPHEDVGKVLALAQSLETILPLMSAPIYSILYQKTLTTFPAAYNLISMSLYIICFLLLLSVHIIQRRHPNNTENGLLIERKVSD